MKKVLISLLLLLVGAVGTFIGVTYTHYRKAKTLENKLRSARKKYYELKRHVIRLEAIKYSSRRYYNPDHPITQLWGRRTILLHLLNDLEQTNPESLYPDTFTISPAKGDSDTITVKITAKTHLESRISNWLNSLETASPPNTFGIFSEPTMTSTSVSQDYRQYSLSMEYQRRLKRHLEDFGD